MFQSQKQGPVWLALGLPASTNWEGVRSSDGKVRTASSILSNLDTAFSEGLVKLKIG